MDQLARTENLISRRAPRLGLGMPARLITLDRTLSVVVEDLSEGGAKITLPVPHDFVVCVLRWMDYHCFADLRWRDGLSAGLQFDKPISAEMLEAARRYAPGLTARVKPGEMGPRYC